MDNMVKEAMEGFVGRVQREVTTAQLHRCQPYQSGTEVLQSGTLAQTSGEKLFSLATLAILSHYIFIHQPGIHHLNARVWRKNMILY